MTDPIRAQSWLAAEQRPLDVWRFKMGSLPERKARTIYVTGSFVAHNGRRRKVVLESRPEYAVLKLIGTNIQYPIAWEALFDAAAKHHAENVRVEALPQKQIKAARAVKKK